MELHIKIIGLMLVVLSLVHFIFPRYFKWKQELVSLMIFNRQVMYVHTFFVALIVFLMGLLCLSSADQLISTPLGNKIIWGMAFFWAVRLLVQFFGYSSKIWRGKKFETFVHVVFSALWIYIVAVFVWVGIS